MTRSFRAKRKPHPKPNKDFRSSILAIQRKENLLRQKSVHKSTSPNDEEGAPKIPHGESQVKVLVLGNPEPEGNGFFLNSAHLDHHHLENSTSVDKSSGAGFQTARTSLPTEQLSKNIFGKKILPSPSAFPASSSLQRTLVCKKKEKSLRKKIGPKKSSLASQALENKSTVLSFHSLETSPSSDQVSRWEICSKTVPKSCKQTSILISKFHTIEKILARTTDPLQRKQLLKQRSRLGGLSTYQAASTYAGSREKGGETGKWCAKALKEHFGCQKNITLLDVGAISGTSYQKFPWIKTTSIDLNPHDEEKVLKYDFLNFPIPMSSCEKFDVIGLSLVLNFLGDLKQRSDIIRHAHQYLKPFGYLFIVLPLACLENSRYLNSERFTKILASLGFVPIKQHNSSKLTFWLTQRSGSEGLGLIQKDVKWNKEELRKGAKRNNFCIKV